MKHTLRFASESEMLQVLLSAGAAEQVGSEIHVIPQSPIGVVDVRGVLGIPGQYAPNGTDPNTGEPLWAELVATVVWPGYHVDLYAEEVPTGLQGYVI